MAGRLLLFSLPLLTIAAGWARGCRPGERVLVVGVASAAGATLIASLVLLEVSGSALSAGAAYAATVIFTAALAMILRRRPERGEDGGGSAEPDSPPPFDWDDFERRFWAEVERRRASSGRGTPGSGRSPSRPRSVRSYP